MPRPILSKEEWEDFLKNAPPGKNKPQDEGELMISKMKKKDLKKTKKNIKGLLKEVKNTKINKIDTFKLNDILMIINYYIMPKKIVSQEELNNMTEDEYDNYMLSLAPVSKGATLDEGEIIKAIFKKEELKKTKKDIKKMIDEVKNTKTKKNIFNLISDI